MKLNLQQNTAEWQRARLGNISASAIAKLIGKGRSKTDLFNATGRTYIYETAAGRMVDKDKIANEGDFYNFANRIGHDTYATRYGHDTEDEARQAYQQATGNKVDDGAMYQHDEIDHLTASPDGLVGDDGLIEVKCPYGLENFVKYAANVKDGDSLKATEPKYYWQIQCQLACTGRTWCDFVVYDPIMTKPLHIARIERNDADIAEMLDKVKMANAEINDIINQLTDF